MSANDFDTQGCGCCEPQAPRALPAIYNRPLLPAIQYRMGTFSSLRADMLRAASRSANPFLREWLGRDERDYGVVLVEMWALIGDILTFYQERIANEAFLRTATHRESVVRLAALLDYRPAPGVAAMTTVAFVVEKQKSLMIPVGLRIQSVPGQNEKPQKFETVDSIVAAAKYNQLRIYPAPLRYNPFARGQDRVTLGPDVSGVFTKPLATGDRLVLCDWRQCEVKDVARVFDEEGRARLFWSPAIISAEFNPFTARLYTWRRQIAAFGSNCPETYMEPVEDNRAPGGIRWTILSPNYSLDFGISRSLPLELKADDIKAGSRILMSYPDAGGKQVVRRATVSGNAATPLKSGPVSSNVSVLELGLSIQSSPLLVLDGSGRLHAFVIGDDQAVWYRRQLESGMSRGWGAWSSLGGNAMVIGVERDGAGRLHVFAVSKDRQVWRATQLGLDNWGDWVPFAEGSAVAVSPARRLDGRLCIFRRSETGEVSFSEQDPSGNWTPWLSLGGRVDMLVAAVNADGSIAVFGRGAQQDLVYRKRIGVDGAWKDWKSLEGVIDLVAVGRHSDGRLNIFARGGDKALWVIRQTGPGSDSWTEWTSLGGWIDLLAVTNSSAGRLEVFARGANQGVWWMRQTALNASLFSAWQSVGGVIDQLGAGANADGRIELFTRGAGEAAFQFFQSHTTGGFVGPIGHGYPIAPIPDRRRLTVFELTSDAIPVSEYTYAESITGSSIAVPVASIDPFEVNRTIILDDAAHDAQTTQVTSATKQTGHWILGITPALRRALDSRTAVLHGNAVKATHGETVSGETLGSGAASERFQSFEIKKAPVTYVSSPLEPNGVRNTLEVRVDGVLWKEARTLLGRGDGERVYTTRLNDAGTMVVQFGGAPGARLTSGRGNVVARYRQGLGPNGNVRRAAITTLLDRPAGLKSALNPAPAEGGSAAETIERARANAPNTVRTFERIVSLLDFEDAAREHAFVAKARAHWEWDGDEQAVVVTVAGGEGKILGSAALAEIAAYLNARRDPNRKMTVRPHRSVRVEVVARVQTYADRLLDNVQADAINALKTFFSFDRLALGQPVMLMDVYRVLQREVPGALAVDVETLRVAGAPDPPAGDLAMPPDGVASLDLPSGLQVNAQFGVL